MEKPLNVSLISLFIVFKAPFLFPHSQNDCELLFLVVCLHVVMKKILLLQKVYEGIYFGILSTISLCIDTLQALFDHSVPIRRHLHL